LFNIQYEANNPIYFYFGCDSNAIQFLLRFELLSNLRERDEDGSQNNGKEENLILKII